MKNDRSRCSVIVSLQKSSAMRCGFTIRFCLSFRDVEDLLAERGILVSYEAIRLAAPAVMGAWVPPIAWSDACLMWPQPNR
jgi:hypothetical protein